FFRSPVIDDGIVRSYTGLCLSTDDYVYLGRFYFNRPSECALEHQCLGYRGSAVFSGFSDSDADLALSQGGGFFTEKRTLYSGHDWRSNLLSVCLLRLSLCAYRPCRDFLEWLYSDLYCHHGFFPDGAGF